MTSLSLTLVEIIVLMLGAVTLGITIHFFIASRKSFKATTDNLPGKLTKELEEWKLRYFNDVEARDKELAALKQKFAVIEENNDINSIEAEEVRKLNKELKAEIQLLRSETKTEVPSAEKPGYIEQLRQAQSSLLEHNEKINKLLGQIDIVKETEEKQQEIQKINKDLSHQVDDLKSMLSEKEKEIHNTRQQEHLTSEMTSRLDNAYNEFNVLQDKIQKLESQVNASKLTSLDYEDLKEAHHKVVHDFEEQKLKYNAKVTESQQLKAKLEDVEDKYNEANFQRQQLQKKVIYLEELNTDMQAVSEANKKLEGQLKRIGELESMLNVVAEERDIAKKQSKSL